jgi:hypothetical protein
MRYYEFKPTLNKFLATLVINNRLHRTIIKADTLNQARSLLAHTYGLKSIANIKPLKSSQLKMPIVPTSVKRQDLINKATYKLAQQKLVQHDSAEIMKKAQDNLETLQKRVDLEHEKRAKLRDRR